jgi:TolB-like protein
MGKLYEELKQRKVVGAIAVYALFSWVTLQVVDVAADPLDIPLWVPRALIIAALIGFPVVACTSWFFDITRSGLVLSSDSSEDNRKPIGVSSLSMLTLGVLIISVFVSRQWETVAILPPEMEPAVALLTDDTVISASANSIAVLPFVDMSVNMDQEYMSDGIAEEMLNLLAKIPALRVTARTSAFSFKGKELTIPEIGEQLNVAHVLEGSVRTAGNQIRITAQLIEVSTDIHLWSETYTRELVDIFAIQDEIAAEVVRNLELRLSGDIHVERAIPFEAYSLFLQAKYLLNQGTYESSKQAAELYEQVLTIVPDYAPALTALKFVFSSSALMAESDLDDQFEWINRALDSDPNYAPALAALGELELVQGNLSDAARHISRALTLDAANEDVLLAATLMYEATGRSSVNISEYILRRDPVNPSSYLGLSFSKLNDGRYDDVIAHARAALVLSPDIVGAHWFISAAYLLKEDFQAALEEIEQEPLESYRTTMSVAIYHALGEQAASDEFLRELIENYADSIPFFIVMATTLRGEITLAFEYLDKSIEVNSPGLWGALTNPALTTLHADPRWPAFLDKAGMSPEILDAIVFDVSLPE